MGMVAITFNVMPSSPEEDINKIKKELEKLGAKQIKEKPIGFGLKALEVLFMEDDKKGIGDIEEKIRKIKGIGSVEAGDVTLV